MTVEPSRRARAPRQADIARLTGVSQATVSMVVNGVGSAHRIPEATRDRILAAARALGYVPNASARSLQGLRNNLIGVHTFSSVFPVSERDFFFDFLVGIERRAEQTGNDLVLFTSSQGADGRRHIYHNGANRLNLADGSVLFGVTEDRHELARLHGDGYPFVHIGRRELTGVELNYVSPDYTGATADVVRRLAGLGHRRISYVGSPKPAEASRDHRAGYRAALAECGLRRVSPVEARPDGMDAGRLDAMIDSGMTAVLAESEALGVNVAERLAVRGLSVPEDVSIVILSDIGGRSTRPWSFIEIRRNEVGRRAVDMLLDLLDGPPDRVSDGRHELVACVPPSETTMAPPPHKRSKSAGASSRRHSSGLSKEIR